MFDQFEKFRFRHRAGSTSKSILPPPPFEGILPSFEQFFHEFPNGDGINGTYLIGSDSRTAALRLACWAQTDDEFGIAQNRNVRVVGGEHELSASLFFPDARHNAFGDEAVVQVVLRLIDDERCLGLQQQQQEHCRRLLTGGGLVQRVLALRLAKRCGV